MSRNWKTWTVYRATTLIVVALVLVIGLGVGYLLGNSCPIPVKRPAMSWVAQDGTVLVLRDQAKSDLQPDWRTIYTVLPAQVRMRTIDIVLAKEVPGAVDARLVYETRTGWVVYVQLGDISRERRSAFANAAVVYSAALMEGQPREVAIQRVMQMAQNPMSFR